MPNKNNVHPLGNTSVLNPATLMLVSAFALVTLGVTILFSASISVDKNSPYLYIEKQVVWLSITFIVGLIILKLDLEWLRKFIWVGYAVGILGLLFVLVPDVGIKVNGSRSWLPLGPFRLQVAEVAKIGLVFFLAHYFSLQQARQGSFLHGFFYPCLAIGGVVGLVMMQTDLGTALVISAVSLCVLFLAGVKLYYLIPSVFLGFGGVIALIYNDVERWSRLTAHINIENQKADTAYQVWQAILAFGAGGFGGVGLGNGRQQLQFLPEAHTDFILAIVGEELGLFVTLGVVLVYSLLFFAGIMHLRKAPNMYQYILAAGCLLMVSVQAVINLGVVTGCLPTTGLPLPFISYGGSNVLVMGICIAILLNTCVAWQTPALKQSRRRHKQI